MCSVCVLFEMEKLQEQWPSHHLRSSSLLLLSASFSCSHGWEWEEFCLPVNLGIHSIMRIKTMSGGSFKCNNLMSRYSRHTADTEELWSYQIISKHCLVKFYSWESSSYLFVCLRCNDGYNNLILYYPEPCVNLRQYFWVLYRCLVWIGIGS